VITLDDILEGWFHVLLVHPEEDIASAINHWVAPEKHGMLNMINS
jgi:hypothetical protein